jgi:4-aminobutyrate aminotransferase-like enzyme
MADEVQSGFCRTGKWFSYQHFNIIPDVVMVAKLLVMAFLLEHVLLEVRCSQCIKSRNAWLNIWR